MHFTLSVRTSRRNELVDITSRIESKIDISGITNGILHIFIPHTTAGVTINENADPDVKTDILRKLSEMVPQNDNFLHMEGNSDAHIKASMMGFSSTVPIIDGKLVLGTWQGIYFCEFDGPRNRKCIVNVIKSA